jgi:protease-4
MAEEQSKKTGFGCLFKGFIIFFFFSAFMMFFSLSALVSIDDMSAKGINVKLVNGHEEQEKHIVEIALSGVMMRGENDLLEGKGLTNQLLKMLDIADQNPKVKGILLRLNTPGGSVTDADLIYHKIDKMRQSGKKFLLLMDDICASGGYYVALATDEVWALPTTITGSIGVIMQSLNFYELIHKYGVTDESITSGPNKAMLSPTQPSNPQHKILLQSIVDELYDRFVSLMAKGRKMTKEEAKKLADGRIYTAQQALSSKLIDQIGYREEAMDRLKELLGGGDFAIYQYQQQHSFFDSFGAQLQQSLSSQQHYHQLNRLFPSQQAYYLYSPQGLLPLILTLPKQ